MLFLPFSTLCLVLLTTINSTAANSITLADQPSAQAVFDWTQNDPKNSSKYKVCTQCSLNFGGSLPYVNDTKSVNNYFYDLSDKYGCLSEDYLDLKDVVPDKSGGPGQSDEDRYYVIIQRGECNFQNKSEIIFNLNNELNQQNKINFQGAIMTSKDVMVPGNSSDTDVQYELLMCTLSESCYKKLEPKPSSDLGQVFLGNVTVTLRNRKLSVNDHFRNR